METECFPVQSFLESLLAMRKIIVSTILITLAIVGTVDGDITCYECSEPNPCTTFEGDENYNFGTPQNCSGTDHCVKTVDSGMSYVLFGKDA